MNRRHLIPLFALIAIASCNQGVEPPRQTRVDVGDVGHVTPSGKHADRLRSETAFEQERIGRDQYGLLTVTIPVRSTVDYRTLQLEYQYSFFDASGRLVEGPMGWIPITLESGSPNTIQFTSTQPTATDFHVNIRYLR